MTSTVRPPALEPPDPVDVDRPEILYPVAGDRPASREHGVGQLLGRRPAVRRVVLDAEILVRAARIVAGRQDDAAEGAALADDMRGGRRRKDAALPDDDLAEAIGGSHADDGLDHLAVEVAAVAADHQRPAGEAFQRIEQRLDEILRVVLLLEDGNLLAQAGGARLLIGKGGGLDGPCHDQPGLLETSDR